MEKFVDKKFKDFREKRTQWKWLGIATVVLMAWVLWTPMSQWISGLGNQASTVNRAFMNTFGADRIAASLELNVMGLRGTGNARFVSAYDVERTEVIVQVGVAGAPIAIGLWAENDFGTYVGSRMIIEIPDLLGINRGGNTQYVWDTSATFMSSFARVLNSENSREVREAENVLERNLRRLRWNRRAGTYQLEMTGAQVQAWGTRLVRDAQRNRAIRDNFEGLDGEELFAWEEWMESISMRVIISEGAVRSVDVTVVHVEYGEMTMRITFMDVGDEIGIELPNVREDAVQLTAATDLQFDAIVGGIEAESEAELERLQEEAAVREQEARDQWDRMMRELLQQMGIRQ